MPGRVGAWEGGCPGGWVPWRVGAWECGCLGGWVPGRVGALEGGCLGGWVHKGVSEGVRECMTWFGGLGVCSLL